MKTAKQLATSKRMWFGSFINVGWLTLTLTELKALREAGEALFDGHSWAGVFGLAIVIIASIGLAWTKYHDDKENTEKD